MVKEVSNTQKDCSKCHESLNVEESLFAQKAKDLRHPYLNSLQHRLLSSNRSDMMEIQRKSSKLFVEDGLLLEEGSTKRLSNV